MSEDRIRIGRTREFPFFQVDTAILDDEELSMKAKMVYVSLCRFADRQFQCYPSLATISKKAGCTKPTVLAGIKELEDKGYLQRENRFANGESKSNFYNLMPGGGKASLPGGSQIALPPSKDALPGGSQIALPPSKEALPELYLDNHTNSELDKIKKPVNPEATNLARLLLDLHRGIDPKYLIDQTKAESSIARWARDIDCIIRLDGRDVSEVERVIRWAKSDRFWSSNIISGSKLREKFDTLIVQAKADGVAGSAPRGQRKTVEMHRGSKDTRTEEEIQRDIEECKKITEDAGVLF